VSEVPHHVLVKIDLSVLIGVVLLQDRSIEDKIEA
jgi:hypothetical protein